MREEASMVEREKATVKQWPIGVVVQFALEDLGKKQRAYARRSPGSSSFGERRV
jgi:hypothetical protein